MDGGYDTDAISLTSTVESTNEGVYEINRFLSEGIGADEDGNPFKKYLVEWDNYPLHQQVFTMKVRENVV
jgi:chromo domain-containing protein 1